MNRRAFLTGIAAAVVAASLPGSAAVPTPWLVGEIRRVRILDGVLQLLVPHGRYRVNWSTYCLSAGAESWAAVERVA